MAISPGPRRAGGLPTIGRPPLNRCGWIKRRPRSHCDAALTTRPTRVRPAARTSAGRECLAIPHRLNPLRRPRSIHRPGALPAEFAGHLLRSEPEFEDAHVLLKPLPPLRARNDDRAFLRATAARLRVVLPSMIGKVRWALSTRILQRPSFLQNQRLCQKKECQASHSLRVGAGSRIGIFLGIGARCLDLSD